MSLKTEIITAAQLADLTPYVGQNLNDGGNLFLEVSASSATWYFRGHFAGKPLKRSFGQLTTTSADEARDLATQFRRLIRDGKDPRNVVKIDGVEAKARPIFLTFAHEQLARKTFKQDAKTRAAWVRTIDEVCKPLHNIQLHLITTADVVKALAPIWKVTPVAAGEARGRIFQVIEAAKALEHVDRNLANPAGLKFVEAVLDPLPKAGSTRGGHKELPYRRMPQFWLELRAIDTVASKLLQLQILTALRPGEALQVAFSQVQPAEYEDNAKSLNLPGRVMKHKDNIPAYVPLTGTAVAIIDEMRALLDARGCEKETLVFPGQSAKPGEYGVKQDDTTVLKMLQDFMGYNGKGDKPKCTRHGFRSTFRSYIQDETEHSDQTAEFCLHHIKGDSAKLAYLRGDMWKKRKACLLDWERYVTSLEVQQGNTGKNIVEFPRAA